MRNWLLILVVAGAACGVEDRLAAPESAVAFRQFVAVGTGLTMGEQSAGVLYESQLSAWPAQLAARVGATFRVPALRAPGCTPPLVAPLMLYRNLAGPVIAGAAGCSGHLGADTLPANNVAMAGATVWDALHTSPRSFAALAASLDQSRYALVLPSVQTQLQAAQSMQPTLLAVELGTTEVLRAAASGLVIVGSSYTQKTPWTLMPAAVLSPVLDSIADSVAATGARAVFVGVPALLSLPAWRVADALWQQRAAFTAYGIDVADDCRGSASLVNTVALLPPLVAAARAAAKTQTLSCVDQSGVADFILTAADAALITQTVTAINTVIKAAADKRGFAYVDVPAVGSDVLPVTSPTWVSTLLGSDAPFGAFLSLDGMQPSAAGQTLIANAVAGALNAKYGLSIPIVATATPSK